MSEIIGIQAAEARRADGTELSRPSFSDDCCATPVDFDAMHPARRWEWMQARVMLFKLLKSQKIDARLVMNAEFGYPELVHRVSGKPVDRFVSWSHTLNFVVVVVGKMPIGIDTEALDRKIGRTIGRIAEENEVKNFTHALRSTDSQLPAPLALWCAKEAIAKAGGLGLRAGLKNFQLTPENDGRFSVKLQHQGPRRLLDPVVSFSRREGFLVAVCSERTELLDVAFRGGA